MKKKTERMKMSKELERRTLSLEDTGLEVRQNENGETELTGFPIVFNSLSHDLGGFREKISPNAFDEQLSRQTDIVFLANHDTASVLGRESNNTLELNKTDNGIRMTAKPNTNTTDGADTVARVKRKDIVGMSFGFRVLEDEVSRNDDEEIIREIQKAEVVEVSSVTFPAYPATQISARAMEKIQQYIPNAQSDDTEASQARDTILAAVSDQTADEEQRGAITPHQSPMADKDTNWDADGAIARIRRAMSSDGSGEKSKIDFTRYAKAFAWVDYNDKTNFQAYKLPHHDIVDGELRVVWRGVVAAAAVVQGAMGGTDIPKRDMASVKRHLKVHYEQFNETPPWEEVENNSNDDSDAQNTASAEYEQKLDEHRKRLIEQKIKG